LENNNLVEKLALQVESFQEGFEILSKSSTFIEMVKNFLHLIRGNFIISGIYSFHKLTHDSKWISLSSIKIPDPLYMSYLSETRDNLIQYFEDDIVKASIILPLPDQSFLGILVGSKLDKSDFTDLDKITMQILIQVFDSAYKSFLNQRKEKTLIFELNEKVLQLNNLIETELKYQDLIKKAIYMMLRWNA
jgi:hypothetical protein